MNMTNATTTKRAKHLERQAAARAMKWLVGAAALAATLLGWMGLSAQGAAEQATLPGASAAPSAALVSTAPGSNETSLALGDSTSRQTTIRRVQRPPRVAAVTRSSR